MAAEQKPALNEALRQKFLAAVNNHDKQGCLHALQDLCYSPKAEDYPGKNPIKHTDMLPYLEIAVLEAARVGNNHALRTLMHDWVPRLVSPTCVDKNLQTPLHLAVANNQVESVKLLLTAPYEPATTTGLKNRFGNTPLKLAEDAVVEIDALFKQYQDAGRPAASAHQNDPPPSYGDHTKDLAQAPRLHGLGDLPPPYIPLPAQALHSPAASAAPAETKQNAAPSAPDLPLSPQEFVGELQSGNSEIQGNDQVIWIINQNYALLQRYQNTLGALFNKSYQIGGNHAGYYLTLPRAEYDTLIAEAATPSAPTLSPSEKAAPASEQKHDAPPVRPMQSLAEEQQMLVEDILSNKLVVEIDPNNGLVAIKSSNPEIVLHYHRALEPSFNPKNAGLNRLLQLDLPHQFGLILSGREYQKLLSNVMINLSSRLQTTSDNNNPLDIQTLKNDIEHISNIQKLKTDHADKLAAAPSPSADTPALQPAPNLAQPVKQNNASPPSKGVLASLLARFGRSKPKTEVVAHQDPSAMEFVFTSGRMADTYVRAFGKITGDSINATKSGDSVVVNLSESQLNNLLALGKQASSESSTIALIMNPVKIKQFLALVDTGPNSTFKSFPLPGASNLRRFKCDDPGKLAEMQEAIEAIKTIVPYSELITIEDDGEFNLSLGQLLALKNSLPLSEAEKRKINILTNGLQSPPKPAAVAGEASVKQDHRQPTPNAQPHLVAAANSPKPEAHAKLGHGQSPPSGRPHSAAAVARFPQLNGVFQNIAQGILQQNAGILPFQAASEVFMQFGANSRSSAPSTNNAPKQSTKPPAPAHVHGGRKSTTPTVNQPAAPVRNEESREEKDDGRQQPQLTAEQAAILTNIVGYAGPNLAFVNRTKVTEQFGFKTPEIAETARKIVNKLLTAAYADNPAELTNIQNHLQQPKLYTNRDGASAHGFALTTDQLTTLRSALKTALVTDIANRNLGGGNGPLSFIQDTNNVTRFGFRNEAVAQIALEAVTEALTAAYKAQEKKIPPNIKAHLKIKYYDDMANVGISGSGFALTPDQIKIIKESPIGRVVAHAATHAAQEPSSSHHRGGSWGMMAGPLNLAPANHQQDELATFFQLHGNKLNSQHNAWIQYPTVKEAQAALAKLQAAVIAGHENSDITGVFVQGDRQNPGKFGFILKPHQCKIVEDICLSAKRAARMQEPKSRNSDQAEKENVLKLSKLFDKTWVNIDKEGRVTQRFISGRFCQYSIQECAHWASELLRGREKQGVVDANIKMDPGGNSFTLNSNQLRCLTVLNETCNMDDSMADRLAKSFVKHNLANPNTMSGSDCTFQCNNARQAQEILTALQKVVLRQDPKSDIWLARVSHKNAIRLTADQMTTLREVFEVQNASHNAPPQRPSFIPGRM